MLYVAHAATPWGIEARAVDVEVDVHNGLPGIQIVGLPDTAVRESRERVRSALRNNGFSLPRRTVVVNLAPADLRKVGNHLDLSIALALLGAQRILPEGVLEGRLICGELGLDGSLRGIRGGLALADLAKSVGARELLLPTCNAAEAALVRGVDAIAVDNLSAAVEHLVGVRPIERSVPSDPEPADNCPGLDLSNVRGQQGARRALEIAAAGAHHLLMIGPPGSGKTMLSRCLPGLLPKLSAEESLLVIRIHSAAGRSVETLMSGRRPFRAPHASISTGGLVGGGSFPRPGEISLAHNGVLLLDEFPEFRRDALESLRQPLEEGAITVSRVGARVTYPARFSLVAAMNPCRCGHLGDPRHECLCTPTEIDRYRKRISGPLLDRIDLHVEVPAVSLSELKAIPAESTAFVAARVAAARKLQRQRLGGSVAHPVNAAMSDPMLARHCQLEGAAQSLLETAFDKLGLSARAVTRILKVSRTIADLAASERIQAAHVAEAIQYRALDHRLT